MRARGFNHQVRGRAGGISRGVPPTPAGIMSRKLPELVEISFSRTCIAQARMKAFEGFLSLPKKASDVK